jgi:hypothetical protein
MFGTSSNFAEADGYNLIALGTNSYMKLTSFAPSSVAASAPEADTSAMLLTGLGVIGFMARRCKNTQA